jgi:hypothetical protein
MDFHQIFKFGINYANLNNSQRKNKQLHNGWAKSGPKPGTAGIAQRQLQADADPAALQGARPHHGHHTLGGGGGTTTVGNMGDEMWWLWRVHHEHEKGGFLDMIREAGTHHNDGATGGGGGLQW